MNLKEIIQISRPRFWFYLAGPYLIGGIFATKNIATLQSPYFILHFLYFLLPANFLLYGINDFFDEDTDKYNTKKGSIEHKLDSKEKMNLVAALLICVSLTFFLLALQTINEVQLLLTLFLFLTYFYSAPPLRFKATPLLDFSSNFLYVIPALVGYYQFAQSFPSPIILIAAFCWTSAMHLFSAIPDIAPDQKAHLNTTAIFLGKMNALLLCLIFWLITASLTLIILPTYISLISLVYPLIPLLLLIDQKKDIKKIYWYFPYINTFCGFILFLAALNLR